MCACVCDKRSIPHTQPPHIQVPPAKNNYKLPSFNYRMRGHHGNGNSMVEKEQKRGFMHLEVQCVHCLAGGCLRVGMNVSKQCDISLIAFSC